MESKNIAAQNNNDGSATSTAEDGIANGANDPTAADGNTAAVEEHIDPKQLAAREKFAAAVLSGNPLEKEKMWREVVRSMKDVTDTVATADTDAADGEEKGDGKMMEKGGNKTADAPQDQDEMPMKKDTGNEGGGSEENDKNKDQDDKSSNNEEDDEFVDASDRIPDGDDEEGRSGQRKSGMSSDDEYFDALDAIVRVRDQRRISDSEGRARQRHSVMKIRTLRSSLEGCSSSKRGGYKSRHNKPKFEMILSFFGHLGDEDLNRTSRKSILNSTHSQRAFRGMQGLDLDKDDEEVGDGVRFFDVEVREYEVKASDNPGVRSGVALELGWKYNVLDRLHLDTFEAKRSKERSKNFKKEKKLSKLERERLLRQFGATEKDMAEAAKRAAKIREKRKKSIEMRQHDKLYEKIENAKTTARRLLRFGSKRSSSDLEIISDFSNSSTLRRASTLLLSMDAMDDGSQASLVVSSQHNYNQQLERKGSAGILKNSNRSVLKQSSTISSNNSVLKHAGSSSFLEQSYSSRSVN